jgi:hypothetical protein
MQHNAKYHRHTELVSGSILPHKRMTLAARWMLERQSPQVKQVQHDEYELECLID